ncbi:MAG: glycerol-3-phosphate dehydrogenase/oxidase [Pseudomonadota bacterium]
MSKPVCLDRRLKGLSKRLHDLVIIGGGITGAGIARQAAAAGLSTLLFDAEDFASGTSSRSTKLIHGGLRYLAMLDFALVREAALERKSVYAMAPHLAEPLDMLVPVSSGFERLKLGVGLSLYERLGQVEDADRRRYLVGSQLSALEPEFKASAFKGAYAYREYLTDDARLVLATLRAAVHSGASVANHAQVIGVRRQGERFRVRVRDRLSGNEIEIRTRAVINAAGPWAERVLDEVGMADGGEEPRLHLSKGVHIAVPHARLPVRNMIYVPAPDGRVLFVIPRGAVTYIGTTDTSHDGGPEVWPSVTGEDIDYLLKPVTQVLRGPKLDRSDVVATWAGLRPLIHQPGKSAREMSRKDEIWVHEDGVITIAGGKLTAFRKMADDVLKQVATQLAEDVTMSDPLAPLPGGEFEAAFDLGAEAGRIAARYQLDERSSTRLVRLYGSEVEAVLGDDPQPISPSVFREEIEWAVRTESARSLEDLIYRRLRIGWYEPDELAEVIPEASERMAAMLDWSAADQSEQRLALEERLAADLAAVPSGAESEMIEPGERAA